VPGATWRYDIEQHGNGRVESETERILPRQFMIRGERTFQRVGRESDGDVNVSLEQFGAEGAIELHKRGKSEFHEPILLPHRATVGQRVRSEGESAAKVLDWFIVDNAYTANVRILDKERIRVAAGTFSTVKVRVSVEIAVDSFQPRAFRETEWVGPATLKGTIRRSQTLWLARGVGAVKSISKEHFRMTVNGERITQDETTTRTLRSYSIPKQ
jgi:hypothetical protein